MSWGERFATGSRELLLSGYQDPMVRPMFEPWGELLLAAVAVEPGESVLDIACGPGTVTRLAAARVGPSGSIVGCDLSPAMIAIACDKGPVANGAQIEYLEAPADRLPVDDERFDVVVCQQGLQFFPDKPAAVAEMHRALRPGGRLGVAIWTRIEQCPPFAAIAAGITEVLGEELGARYRDGPWGMPRLDELRELISEAGFVDVDARPETLPVVFDGGPTQLIATLLGGALAPEVSALGPDERQRLNAAIARHAEPITVDGAVRSRLVSNLATARR
jgi:SAM-dependent methyltransferase